MTTLKYRNPSINLKKREMTTVKSLFKDFSDEFTKYIDSKSNNDSLNNIITEEIVKVVKRLSKKYGFDFNEGLTFAIKSKITENTPKSLIDGIVDDNVEDISFDSDSKKETNIYNQVMINENKYYTKNEKIFDQDLKEVGKIFNNQLILF